MSIIAILGSPLARRLGPYLGVALTVWGAYLFAHGRGVADCERKHQLALAESVDRAWKASREIALQDAELSAGFETTRTRIQVAYRTIEKEVVREIPADCTQCRIAPAGLGMLNDAISGRAFKTTPSGESDQSVRVPKPPTAGHVPGSGRQIGGIQLKTL